MRTNSITLNSVKPAGRRFMGFIAALNSGNPEMIAAFIRENYADAVFEEVSVEDLCAWHMDIFKETGGVRVHTVYLSQDHFVVIVLRGVGNDVLYMDKLKVEDDAPHKIVELQHSILEG